MSDSSSNKEFMVEIASDSDVHAFETGKLDSRGGTEEDARDMQMLGRTQVLNVSPLPAPCLHLLYIPSNQHSATSASCPRSASPARS